MQRQNLNFMERVTIRCLEAVVQADKATTLAVHSCQAKVVKGTSLGGPEVPPWCSLGVLEVFGEGEFLRETSAG